MIDDVLMIMKCGEWMNTRDICMELLKMDPIRYRTVSRDRIPPILKRLKEQGFTIEKYTEYYDGAKQCVYFKLVS